MRELQLLADRERLDDDVVGAADAVAELALPEADDRDSRARVRAPAVSRAGPDRQVPRLPKAPAVPVDRFVVPAHLATKRRLLEERARSPRVSAPAAVRAPSRTPPLRTRASRRAGGSRRALPRPPRSRPARARGSRGRPRARARRTPPPRGWPTSPVRSARPRGSTATSQACRRRGSKWSDSSSTASGVRTSRTSATRACSSRRRRYESPSYAPSRMSAWRKRKAPATLGIALDELAESVPRLRVGRRRGSPSSTSAMSAPENETPRTDAQRSRARSPGASRRCVWRRGSRRVSGICSAASRASSARGKLLEEQRVARAALHERGQILVGQSSVARRRPHERPRIVRGKRLEPQGESGERRRSLGGGESASDGSPGRAREPGSRRSCVPEVTQQLGRRVVHPVDVLEHEQGRRVEQPGRAASPRRRGGAHGGTTGRGRPPRASSRPRRRAALRGAAPRGRAPRRPRRGVRRAPRGCARRRR